MASRRVGSGLGVKHLRQASRVEKLGWEQFGHSHSEGLLLGEAAGLLLWFGVELVWLRDGSVRRGAKHRRHTSRAAKLCSEHVGHCQSPGLTWGEEWSLEKARKASGSG
jgi:hypothetical protein